MAKECEKICFKDPIAAREAMHRVTLYDSSVKKPYVYFCNSCHWFHWTSGKIKVKKFVLILALLTSSVFAATVAENLADGFPVSGSAITPAKGSLWIADGTQFLPLVIGTNNYVLTADSAQALGVKWAAAAVTGVTSVSVVSANGFTGTVSTATTTPAITLSTSITGVLKGNATAISAAIGGTDYLLPSGSGSALTNLNASNLSSGTVATSRLGSGTANSGTVLHGDSTWGTAGGLVTGSITTPDVIADNIISPTATTQKSLVIQGQPSQTANLFEAQDSTGAVLASINKDGAVISPTGFFPSASFVAGNRGLVTYSGAEPFLQGGSSLYLNATYHILPGIDPGAGLGIASQRYAEIFLTSSGVHIGGNSGGSTAPTITSTGAVDNESIVLTPTGTGIVSIPAMLTATAFSGNGSGLTGLTAPGLDTYILFNSGGTFGSNSSVTFNGGIFSISGGTGLITLVDALRLSGNLSNPGTFTCIWADGSNCYANNSSGSATQISPHAIDAPEILYDRPPGIEHIFKSSNDYIGEIEWTNETRLARKIDGEILGKCHIIESYLDYNKRTGNNLKIRDWNIDQQKRATELQARNADAIKNKKDFHEVLPKKPAFIKE